MITAAIWLAWLAFALNCAGNIDFSTYRWTRRDTVALAASIIGGWVAFLATIAVNR